MRDDRGASPSRFLGVDWQSGAPGILPLLSDTHPDTMTVPARRTRTGSPNLMSQQGKLSIARVAIVAAIDGSRVVVRNLEAFDGTLIVDVEPVLARGR